MRYGSLVPNAGFQRARRPEQKAQRRAEILAAARELLDGSDVHSLSLNGLARAVGLAKSNVYRYFESREAVLLAVLTADLDEWTESLAESMARARSKDRIGRLATLTASSCAARPRMCRLICALSAVLERNASAETVRAFKMDTLRRVDDLATALHAAVPELGRAQHMELIRFTFPYIAGIWPVANPAEVAVQVMEDSTFAALRYDFETELARAIEVMAHGLRVIDRG